MEFVKKEKKESLFANPRRKEFNLANDFVFRAVFGRDKPECRDALIGILNVILEREDNPIVSLTIKNPIDLGDVNTDKETVMDIRASTNNGEQLDIEMQSGHLTYYSNRVIFYCGRLINSSLQEGEYYDKMKKSIVVSIINGKMFPSNFSCHSTFTFKERTLGYELTDIALLHFVELGRIDGKTDPCKLSKVEKLAAYLKFANDERYEDYLHKLFEEEGEGYLTMAEKVFRELTEDEKQCQLMESRFRYQLQYNTDMHISREEGLAAGKEVGQAQFAKLTGKLLSESRLEDLQRAIKNVDYRKKLFEEYKI